MKNNKSVFGILSFIITYNFNYKLSKNWGIIASLESAIYLI